MSTEISHYFRSEAKQTTEPDPGQRGEDYLRIKLRVFKEFQRRRSLEDPSVTYRKQLVDRHNLAVRLARIKRVFKRQKYTRWIARFLSRMRIPEDEHPTIIQNIFQVINGVVSCNNINPIRVVICEVTVNLVDDIDRVIRESMDTYRSKLIPASKYSIQDLKNVRLLDNFELEAIITRTPSCAICLNLLDHFDDVQQPMRVTRLPCSHSYHENCIVHWLEINHVCPLCRYPMPTEELGEPSSKP